LSARLAGADKRSIQSAPFAAPGRGAWNS
jgi:hypothetical protein